MKFENLSWKWKNFQPNEILSPQGLWDLNRRGVFRLQGHAVDFLDKYRDLIGKPLLCNHRGLHYRGWRSEQENAKIGGVKNSQHIQGLAFDLSCYEISRADFLIQGIRAGWSALVVYPDRNFIHHDLRTLLGTYQIIHNSANFRTIQIEPEHKCLPDDQLYEIIRHGLKLPTTLETIKK